MTRRRGLVRRAVELSRDGAQSAFGTGLVGPMSPRRVVRVGRAISRYGLTLATAAEMSAIRYPHRTAIVDERGSVTYAELSRRGAALADALHYHGLLRQGERLGILCRNHRDFVVASVAGGRLGADLVFLSTDLAAPALAGVLQREQVTIVLHDDELAGVVDGAGFAGRRVVAGSDVDSSVRGPAPPAPRPTRPGRLVVLTSGTTGTPKGAPRESAQLRMGLPVTTLLAALRLRSGEPMVIQPPLVHGFGLGFLAAALTLGCPAILRGRYEPQTALAMVEEHRASVLVCVPIILHRIMQLSSTIRAAHETSSLRAIVSGAAPLRVDLSRQVMAEFGDILFDLYGTTEAGWATLATPDDLRRAPGTVGRPAHGVAVAVLDDDGAPLEPRRVGHVYVGSRLVFHGYTGGGGRTVVGGLMSTGDLGRLDPDGRLFVLGRADDMIVSGGENVHPREVEDLLAGHPAVADVTVFGTPDPEFGQRLAAKVVRAAGAAVSSADLAAYVGRTLGRNKVPRDVEFVTALERTGSGKVRRLREKSGCATPP
ncbi:MAG: AMP-binding protein [Jiangellaceae bacterium]